MSDSIEVNIKHNHILFEAQNDISEICKPLFDFLKIGYFHFRRTFQDGSYFVLSTDSNWSLYFIKKKVPVKTPVIQKFLDSKSYFCLWQGNIPDETLSVARNFYGIKSAIAMVERNKTYFDSYSFGSKKNKEHTYDVYINNIDSFLKFISYFQEKAIFLIAKANKQLIVPADSLKDINLRKIMNLNECDEKEKFIEAITVNKTFLKTSSGCIFVTKREAECLHHLSHGRNRKEIGNLIGLSPRTVDTHLEKAKNKLGCLTSSALIELWWENQQKV